VGVDAQTVEIVIDELVLDGVEASDSSVGQALTQTLGPALAEHGLAASTLEVTRAVTSAVTDGAEQ
jgi:hypothetical protein